MSTEEEKRQRKAIDQDERLLSWEVRNTERVAAEHKQDDGQGIPFQVEIINEIDPRKRRWVKFD